jgi:ABC-type multidrug transport system ATPase subunit
VHELAVRCDGIEKRYGDVVAVAGLSLHVRRGECFGLLGPNGAGKTTTIEILEGLLAADAGDVEVLGLRWSTDERELRERLGIHLQETQLSEKLTVEEMLRLFRSFYRRGRPVGELLQLVELDGKRGSRVVPSRAVRSRGCRSRARSPATRTCCSWTSRPPGSTRSRDVSSGRCSAASAPTAARLC